MFYLYTLQGDVYGMTLLPVIPAGKQTINSLYGTRVAVLAGDFLFAQSSWHLANLDNLEVCGHCDCAASHTAECTIR